MKKKKLILIIAIVLSCVIVVGGIIGIVLGVKNCSDKPDTSGSSSSTESTVGGSSGGSSGDSSSDSSNDSSITQACTHENKSTEVTKAATCITDGLETVVCNDCNQTVETKVVLALGHDYQIVAEETVAATCTTNGKTKTKCSRCDVATEEEIVAPGHTWVNAEDLLAGDCEDASCKTCQTTRPATKAHSYKKDETASIVATCAQEGKDVYKCSACSSAYEEVIGKGDHVIADDAWVIGTLTKDASATTCTYNRIDTAVCTACQQGQTRTMKVEHNYKLVNLTPATCISAGSNGLKCEGCELVDTNTVISFPGTHKWVTSGATTACEHCAKTQKVVSGVTTAVTQEELQNNDIQFAGNTSLTMDGDVVAGLAGATSMNLSAEGLSKDQLEGVTLNEEDLAKLGDAPVYNLTLEVDGTPKSALGGYVTVTVPYTLKDGEDPNSISIGYVSGSHLEIIEGATYANGFVTFQTNHFSYYCVSKLVGAEICEHKYGGHHYVKSVKKPTCVLSGYSIEVCTRCGTQSENSVPYIAPNGHTLVEDTTKAVAANCTSMGQSTFKCSKCEVTLVRVLPALGHAWFETKNVPATCQAAGYREISCVNPTCPGMKEGVPLSYKEEFPQTAHNYVKETTEATCTADGRIDYKCANSGCTSATFEILPATGHTWDVAQSTCGQGQTCLTCGAAGAPATGAHTLVNGVCSVCGEGCEHEYAVKEQVVATCTTGGYTLKECTKCQKTVTEDIVTAKGHVFNGALSACSTCGAKNVNFNKAIRNLLASVVADGYTVKLEGFKITGTTTYPLEDNKVVTEINIEIKVGEAYLSVKDEKVTAYLNGKLEYTVEGEKGSGEVQIYGDGEYAYLYVTGGEVDEYLSPEAYYLTIAYDAIISQLSFGMDDDYKEEGGFNGGVIIGGGASGSISKDERKNARMSSAMGGMDVSSIGMMLSQLAMVPQVQAVIDMIEAKEAAAYDMIGHVFLSMFDAKTTETGYTFTLNTQKFIDFNEALYTLTVDKLIDKYFGEGTFESVKKFALSLETLTVREAATKVMAFADANGFTTDTIFTAIETVLSMSGKEISIRDLIDSEEYGDLTILELVGSYAEMLGKIEYAKVVGDAFDACKEINLYKLMNSDVEEGDIDIAETVYGAYNAYFKAFSVVITTDKDLTIQSIESKLDNANISVGGDYAYVDGGYVLSEKYGLVLNAKHTITFGATTLPTAIDTKTTVDSKYAAITAAIKAACEADEADEVKDNILLLEDRYGYNGSMYALRLNEGVVSLFLLTREELAGGLTNPELWANPDVADITKMPMASFSQYCGNIWQVTLASDLTGGTLNIYVDIVNNTVAQDAEHKYQNFMPDPTKLPGVPLSQKDAECGGYWYTYEKCSICGDVTRESNWNPHEYEYYAAFKDGSTNCEDGVILTFDCTECGDKYSVEDDNDWEYGDHSLGKVGTYTFTTADGVIVVDKYACPCGRDSALENGIHHGYVADGSHGNNDFFYNDTNACKFGEYSYSYEYDNETGEEYRVYRCIATDENLEYTCGYTLRVYETSTSAMDGCYRVTTTKEVWKLYNGEGNLVKAVDDGGKTVDGIETGYVSKYHQTTSENLYTYFSNGVTKTSGYRYYCNVCGYDDTYMHTYDKYGREIEYISYEKEGGEYDYYNHRKYVYASSNTCRATVYVKETATSEWVQSYTTNNHITVEKLDGVAPTCTQPGRYKGVCKFCQEEYYREYYLGNHSWKCIEVDEETKEELWRCSDCGLESGRPDSNIIMEDLTNHAYYGEEGQYTIGFRDNNWWGMFGTDCDFLVTFEFVELNPAEGEEADKKEAVLDFTFDTAFSSTYLEYYGRYYENTMIRFSVADVNAAASAAGINLADGTYGLQIRFIPTADSNYQDVFTLTDFVL